jgi:hypothetical protein
VQKKRKFDQKGFEKDYISEIVDRGIRPLDYLLSTNKISLDNAEHTENLDSTKGMVFFEEDSKKLTLMFRKQKRSVYVQK